MMELIAGYSRPTPQRPPQHLIGYAKTEVHWILIGGRPVKPERYTTLRTLLVAQWRGARDGSLKPEMFYTTARSMAETLAHLVMIRRTRAQAVRR